MRKELGQTGKKMDALNDPAPTVLRVNTLKTTKEKLIEKLQENEIESHAVRGYEDAVELEEKKNVFLTEAFKRECLKFRMLLHS